MYFDTVFGTAIVFYLNFKSKRILIPKFSLVDPIDYVWVRALQCLLHDHGEIYLHVEYNIFQHMCHVTRLVLVVHIEELHMVMVVMSFKYDFGFKLRLLFPQCRLCFRRI